MVLVVPLDVPMSAGKLAAQSAHAAVGLYKVNHITPASQPPLERDLLIASRRCRAPAEC